MGMTEKDSLINALTLKLVEDYNLSLKDVKSKVSDILQFYHVTISDERFHGEDLTTDYLLNKFEAGKASAGMKANTLKQYKLVVHQIEKATNKKLSDLEAEDVRNYLSSLKNQISSVTIRCKYQLLSSVFNWLYMRKYIPHNPMIVVDAPKADVIYKTPLSDLEYERIKKACEILPEKESIRDNALIQFFVSTGCRVSEVKTLQIKDVDFQKKIVKVMGKGRKERNVILTDRALYRLNLYLDTRKEKNPESPLFASIRGKEHPITSDGIEHIIHKLRKMAGVERLTCHVFRRYYATELRKRNVNIQMIAKSLGHANLNQINRYSLFENQEMQNVIRAAM